MPNPTHCSGLPDADLRRQPVLSLALAACVLFLSPVALAQGTPESVPVKPNWMTDGARFWYAAGARGERRVMVVDPRDDAVAPLFDVGALRGAYEELQGKKAPREGLPFTTFRLVDGDRAARFRIKAREYEWVFAEGTSTLR